MMTGFASTASASNTAFTPVHTYYISPTGSDNNAGTSPSAPWATPHHAVQCGDVIIAAAGNYTSHQFGTAAWGTVSGCPSTTGGIDGTGGVYFATLVCAGPYVTSCTVNGGSSEALRVDASNWAVEKFSATNDQTAANGTGCFQATSETSTGIKYIAFVNDMAINCDMDGFGFYSWNGTSGGPDMDAVVGAVAYNSAPSITNAGICSSGISIIPTNGTGTSAGTHVFVAGNFLYKNENASSGEGCNTDGEGLIFNSWGVFLLQISSVKVLT